MAIGTPVSLGVSQSTTDANSYTHTTTATASTPSLIVMAVFWSSLTNAQTISVSGGSLTWTADKAQTGTKGSNQFGCSIWSAPAPSGLATSTVLTVAMTATADTTNDIVLGACYIPEGSGVEDTDGAFDSAPASPWDTLSMTGAAQMVSIGALGTDSAGSITSTPTGSTVELWETETTSNLRQSLNYRGPEAAGSYTMTGTYSAGVDSETYATVAYNGGAASGPPRTFSPIPFMKGPQ